MTQGEYEQKRRECWEEYKRENLDGEVQWQPVSCYDVFCTAFDRAYALGKQFGNSEQLSADTVISGWVCRDNNSLNAQVLIGDKPKRTGYNYWENKSADRITLPKDSFPDLTWDSDPIEVELTIKRKKKTENQ